MATRITDYTEYAAPVVNDDWTEVCQAATGGGFKIAPNKKVALRSGQQAPNAENKAANVSTPGGNWGGQNAAQAFTHATSVDLIYFSGMFLVRTPITITQASVQVTTAQAASVVRIGVHSAYPDWSLKALVADFGTVDTSTTGRKNITGLSLALPPGQYWSSTAASVVGVALIAHLASPFSLAGPVLLHNFTNLNCYATMFTQAATAPAVNGFSAVASSALSVTGSGSTPGVFQPVFFQWTEN